MTKDLAMINYNKSVKVASMLDLDVNNADTFTSVVENFVPSFLDKKKVLRLGLDIGLMKASLTMQFSSNEQKVRQFLE